MISPSIRKYPRTRHIEGSRLGPGDQDLSATKFLEIAGRFLVVEEKVDGANCALSFDSSGRLWLQSRGHFLGGGPREKQFAALKPWAHANAEILRERLGDRYVMYGEWLYAKHTVYYDALPHYFLEFDVLDRRTDTFLSTAARRHLLEGAPVHSVPVLAERTFRHRDELTALVGPSRFKTRDWRIHLRADAEHRSLDPERIVRETDGADEMEGLYVKVEEGDVVVDRFKWVRRGFLTTILDAGTHWLSRPILPNRLQPTSELQNRVDGYATTKTASE